MQELRILSKNGLSQWDIAKKLNISAREVSRMIGEDIIALRSDNLSLKEIVNLTGYSKANVSKWIAKVPNNLEIKEKLSSRVPASNMVPMSELKERRDRRNSNKLKISKTKLKVSLNRKKKRAAKKALLVKLCGGECCNCGFDKYNGALDFHHIDESEKLFSIRSNNLSRSAADIAAEVNKCALVCTNCHRIVHADKEIFPEIHKSITLKRCYVLEEDLKELF